ncbi:hypothetical protein ACIREO_30170 [Streptomyces sp. NPDC102441]|uniref:hypothetical protein n=1 Tax=Streptomyces sp. NPDC102441 TaxID=3366176 RepID=UPI00380CEFA8
MHGYGYPPEQQPKPRLSSSSLVTLRVVFVALALLSCTFLAWAPMLRLAIVTRKQRDWWLFGLVLALNVGLIVYLGSLPVEDDTLTDGQAIVMLSWMLVVLVGSVTHYLYTDIRHFGPYGGARTGPQAGPRPGPYGNPYSGQHPGPFPSTGFAAQQTVSAPPPQPSPPYGRPPAPQQSSAPMPPAPAAPPTTPRPATPQRLDQVRAELDELSDYLRKEGDSR